MVRCVVRGKKIFSSENWVLGALFLGVRRSGREADHSSPYTDEVNNAQAVPHSSIYLRGVVCHSIQTAVRLLTYFMEQSPSWEANRFWTGQEIPHILWNLKVHEPHPSSPCHHPTFWSSILILSSHLRLRLPSGLFLSGFLTKTLYTPLPSPVRAACPAHLILLDLVIRIILSEEYRSLRSWLCRSLHWPVTSYLLGPNILLNTLFPNTLSLRSSPNVSDEVSHTYKTTGKIIVLYIIIFICLDSKLADKRLCSKW